MIHQCPSPNFGERRGADAPSYIIIHYTAMQTAAEAIERLCAPEHEVSAHYVIDRDGSITQLVPEEFRAWHAGRSFWRGETDLNSNSIGIELANDGFQPFPLSQLDTLADLIKGMMQRWAIPVQNVLGHSDISLGRKTDPGQRFPWSYLARHSCAIGSTVSDAEVSWDNFLNGAAAFGYDTQSPDAVLWAVRARFHPWVRGELSARDCAVMADVAQRYGIDLSDRIA